MPYEGFRESKALNGLSPEQRKMAETAELFYDNIKMGMGGAKKEIHGTVTLDGKEYSVIIEERKGNSTDSETSYGASILGDNYFKRLEGEAAKKFFDFYIPLAKVRHDFENTKEETIQAEAEVSIEDKLLGGK